MKRLLFINACMRGKEKSRTYKLAEAFLQAIADKFMVETIDLNETQLGYLNAERCLLREQLLAEGDLQADEFSLARQFAAADRVVIAAPFWDLSIPAALKVYLENIAATDIAFRYTSTGEVQGLCAATKVLFIATCGGIYQGSNIEYLQMATPYMQGLCMMFGIKEFDSMLLEGLDIYGADVTGLLERATQELLVKAEAF